MKSNIQKFALIFAASLGLAGCNTMQQTTWQPQQVEYTEHQKCKWACCKCAHCVKKHKHHMHKNWHRNCQFDSNMMAPQGNTMTPQGNMMMSPNGQ